MNAYFSRARWFLSTIILSIALGSGCTDNLEATRERPEQSPTTEESPLVREARAILDDILAKRWPEVRARFDPAMMSKLSEDGLAQGWEEFRKIKGEFEAAGNAEVIERPPMTVINIELTMSKGEGQFRVTLDPERRIAGLFFLQPGVPVP